MLRELHDELGIPADYGKDGGPPGYDEAGSLIDELKATPAGSRNGGGR